MLRFGLECGGYATMLVRELVRADTGYHAHYARMMQGAPRGGRARGGPGLAGRDCSRRSARAWLRWRRLLCRYGQGLKTATATLTASFWVMTDFEAFDAGPAAV